MSNGTSGLTVGSLFSGIGGIDLGLERAGMHVVWQVENDPYASRVLAKHWPDVPNLGDITEVDWDVADTEGERQQSRRRSGEAVHAGESQAFQLEGRSPVRTAVRRFAVDLVCGGFPCQDISFAGRGGGIVEGSRSGLWTEYVRCLRALRPRWVFVENVPALLVRRPGMDVVAADLAALGYDLWWDCVPAAAVGAPHRRDRVYVVAFTDRAGLRDATRERSAQQDGPVAVDDGPTEPVAHAGTTRPSGRWRSADSPRGAESPDGGRWAVEPDVGRVAHGVPHRVDRLRCLGNAVVPQVAELVGRAIVEADVCL